MPKEIHYLILAPEEFQECLSEYISIGDTSSMGQFDILQEISLLKTAEGGVSVRFKRTQRGKEPESLELGEVDILSAILLFCRKRRIPIAQRATKSLELVGTQIGLMMLVDFPRAAPRVSDREIQYTGEDALAARSRVQEG